MIARLEGETLVDHLISNSGRLGLNLMQIGRLRQAQRLQGGNRADRKRAKEYGLGVQRELELRVRRAEAQGEQRAIAAGLVETFAIEVAQGGAVVPFNDAGARRLISRDGLAHLRESGKLSARELEVGLIYRAHYDSRPGEIRSQLSGEQGGGGFDPDGAVWGRLMHAHGAHWIANVERAVIAESRGDPMRRGKRELRALRDIAGEGRALSSLAKGGAMQAVYLAALIRALAVVSGAACLYGLTV